MNAHSLLWLPRKPDIGRAKNDQSKTNWSFQELSVTMAPSHTHTVRPLINVPLDLSKVFLDEMYVGFCASTGNLIENHKTLRGTFFQELTFNGICSSHYVNLVYIQEGGPVVQRRPNYHLSIHKQISSFHRFLYNKVSLNLKTHFKFTECIAVTSHHK